MPTVADWSTTAASNALVLGIDIGENCPAANINNAMRELMAEAKAGFVEVTGDTMTGDLTIAVPGASQSRLIFSPTAGQPGVIHMQRSGSTRWDLYMNTQVESGGNAGSNLALNRFDDAGAFLDTPFIVNRSTGQVGLTQIPLAAGVSLVTISSVDTLTNKTLVSPTIDSAPVSTVGGTAPLYFARAVCMGQGRGTNGTCTLLNNQNFASITRNGAGRYDAVLNTALPHANYTVIAMGRISGNYLIANIFSGTSKTSTTFSLTFGVTSTQVATDPTDFDIAVFC